MGRTRKRQSCMNTRTTSSGSSKHQQTESQKETSELFESFMNDDENWSIYQQNSNNNSQNSSYSFQDDDNEDVDNNNDINSSSKTRLFYSSLRKRKRPHTCCLSSTMQQQQKQPSSSFPPVISIPMLLYQREICTSLNMNKIQSKASPFLIQTANKNNHDDDYNPNSTNHNYSKRRRRKRKQESYQTLLQQQGRLQRKKCQWKPSMKRIIPFSQLCTPINDAILGIDSSGSYLISIADGKRFDNITNHATSSTSTSTHNNHDYDHHHDQRNDLILGEEGFEQDQNASFGDESWVRRRRHRHDNHSRERSNPMHERKTHHLMCHPALSLRFYAVPSPASLEPKDHNNISRSCVTSPHVCSIPLSIQNANDRIDREIDSTLSTSLSVSNTRIQILLSKKGGLGVAYVHHTTGEDASSSITLFQIPTCPYKNNNTFDERKYQIICRCSRIRMNENVRKNNTMRNLLWPTPIIPVVRKNDSLNHNDENDMLMICDSLRKTSYGNVLFNDEDDGYRIFWIEEKTGSNLNHDNTFVIEDMHRGKGERLQKVRPQRCDIIEYCHADNTFEYWNVDPQTGYSQQEQQQPQNQGWTRKNNFNHRSNLDSFGVVFESYLHIDALLSDVLYRRRKIMFCAYDTTRQNGFMNIPDFFYNIVSFNVTTGRSVTIVVTFVNPQLGSNEFAKGDDNHECIGKQQQKQQKQPASYGLFIEIDLIDQSYTELEWVVHPTKNDAVFLRNWSNELASLKRMKEIKFGPFGIGDDEAQQVNPTSLWKFTFTENWINVDCFDEEFDLYDEWKENYTTSALLLGKHISSKSHKIVPMASLYRYCDVYSNGAVIYRTPLPKMKSSAYPLEVEYSS